MRLKIGDKIYCKEVIGNSNWFISEKEWLREKKLNELGI